MARWISLLLAFFLASHPAFAAVQSSQAASDAEAQEGKKDNSERGSSIREKALILSAVATVLGVFLMLNGGLNEERELIGETSQWGGWTKVPDERYDYIETEWEDETLRSYGVRYEPDAMGKAGIILFGLGITGIFLCLISYSQ